MSLKDHLNLFSFECHLNKLLLNWIEEKYLQIKSSKLLSLNFLQINWGYLIVKTCSLFQQELLFPLYSIKEANVVS